MITLLVLSFISPVFATSINDDAENLVGLSLTPPNAVGGISPYGTTKPKYTIDLGKEGSYKISGTAESSTLYTNYSFTNVTSMTLDINNLL